MSILNHVSGCQNLVALWYPFTSRRPPDLGDIGFLGTEGGFLRLFNVLLDFDTNIVLGYEPPANFESLRGQRTGELVLDEEYEVDQKSRINLHEPYKTHTKKVRTSFDRL